MSILFLVLILGLGQERICISQHSNERALFLKARNNFLPSIARVSVTSEKRKEAGLEHPLHPLCGLPFGVQGLVHIRVHLAEHWWGNST